MPSFLPPLLSRCEHELLQEIGTARCFIYKDRPVDQQHSYIPRKDVDAVDWYWVPQKGPLSWPEGKPAEVRGHGQA